MKKLDGTTIKSLIGLTKIPNNALFILVGTSNVRALLNHILQLLVASSGLHPPFLRHYQIETSKRKHGNVSKTEFV